MYDITDRFLLIYNDLMESGQVEGPSDFAKQIEISPQMMNEILKKRSKVGVKVIQNTVNRYPLYSILWLIKGEGKMKENFKIAELHKDPDEEYALKLYSTPLVSQEAAAGFGNDHFLIKEEDIQERYVVPDFTWIDFMIRITGSSMYPKYSSGDIVACRIIRESKFIQWNKPYIIATIEQGILCKRLRQSDKEDCYLAVSDNEDYQPFHLPLAEITGLAIIVGVIRVE